jgi:D-alanyl-D-alanine carboxypeptidase-like protein
VAHPSWGSGWPNCSRGDIVTLVRADGLRLPIHRELADLVSLLVDLTEIAGRYDIVPGWTWAFACRPVAGTNQPSNHSWGTAVDINAPVNPRRRPLTTDIPPAVRELWKAHGFRWGGDHVSATPDAMHFEFTGSVTDARAVTARLRRFLADAPAPPRERPPATASGEKGRVMVLQRLLRVAPDGVVGPRTIAAMNHNLIGWPPEVRRRTGRDVDLPANGNPNLVSWLQRQGRRKGYLMTVDGAVGPQTNHLIVVVLGQPDAICGANAYRAAVH